MIEARGLVKRYGPTTAVDHLSFDVGTVTINGKDYRDLRSPLREVGPARRVN